MITPNNQRHPLVVIESEWSESWPRMLDDMKLWLVGGRPDVNVVILLNWSQKANTNQMQGSAEVYIRDVMGKPYLRQQSFQIQRSLRYKLPGESCLVLFYHRIAILVPSFR